jgi:hypothetical protein
MTILNVFRNDAFSSVQLTAGVERNPFNPTGIGDLKLFDPFPIRTKALAVEQRQGKLLILPITNRGEPPTERVTEKRQARYFECKRIAHADTVWASEIQDVREFGQESVLMQLQAEVARRLSGPTGLQASIEYTWERMRLGAIQGKLVDADDSIVYDWFDEFEIAQPTEFGFNLNAAVPVDGALRTVCNQVVRAMARAAQGAFTASTTVMGMCGDEFWDALVSHPDVTKTYYNWAAATELRQGTAFEAMRFGGIDFFNYRGSDDGSSIAIPTDKCKFFPKNAPGVFQVAYAPGESIQWVNTLGKPIYVLPIPDRERNSYWRMEAYSYPLFICNRPEVLQSARLEA